VTKHKLMKKLKAAYRSVWSLWDESEKMIDSAEPASDELVEATNLIESSKLALLHAYQKLGGDIKNL
jgi:hypothetical protein